MSHMAPEPEDAQPVRPTAGDDSGAYVEPDREVDQDEQEAQDGANEDDEPKPA